MDVMTPLWAAIDALVKWQKKNKGHTSGWCLQVVTAGLKVAGLSIPRSWKDFNGNLAINCGKRLVKDPGKWGWVFRGTSMRSLPTDRPSLVFFRDCGRLPDGRIAGHIAIYKPTTNRHIANDSYDMSQWWLERIAYVFVPQT